ncbi:uncharacterized protein PG998_015140 [Apiospora kogelbergensis]|uniref:uncharacterized protein n=1 Tax=Apiospora kogelbergensis TaxID=1337665 RepID=UPI00312D20AF
MEIEFRNYRHDGSKIARFRSSVAQSLDQILQLGDVVAQATKAVYPPAEAIFAAIRYLIGSANAISADFDRLEAFFGELQAELQSLKILEGKLSRIPEYGMALTGVFTSVLVLCGICKWSQALRTGQDEELKQATMEFKKRVRLGQNIILKATLANSLDIISITGTIQDGMSRSLAISQSMNKNIASVLGDTGQVIDLFERQENNEERNTIINWLSSLDYLGKQRDTFAKRHEQTGQWLLNHEQFNTWLSADDNSVLWCHGIPGSGKTVMTATVVSHVEDITSHSNVGIAYVYCDYREPYTESEMLSSIIRQLSQQISPMPSEIKSFHITWVGKKSYPSNDVYIALITSISKLFRRTFVFVDALDECPEETRESFVRLLLGLKSYIRLFLTSRENVDLEATLGKLRSIEIVPDSADVRRFLEFHVDTSSRLSRFLKAKPELRQEIIDTVHEKTDGMFLLASVHIDLIRQQTSIKNIRMALRILPKGIEEYYEQAVMRIEAQSEEDIALAKKALSFIFCSKRTLSSTELLDAVSIEEGSSDIDEESRHHLEILIGICAGLITIDRNTNAIGFIHYTLQEYLQSHRSGLLANPDYEMLKACLSYLSFDVFDEGPCTSPESLELRLEQYRFFGYASQNWGSHVQYCLAAEGLRLVLAFMCSDSKSASSLQVLYSGFSRMEARCDRFPGRFSKLHVAAYWVKTAKGPQLYNWRRNMAMFSYTALIWAGKNGHSEAIRLLLQAQADVLAEDVEGWTALDWAIIGRHNEAAKVLLDHSPSVFGLDRTNKAMILAAEAGNDEAVKILLDGGAEIDWTDDQGSTALDFAVPERKRGSQHGACVNIANHKKRTPLHWSVHEDQIEVLRLLIKFGADVNASDENGVTGLHAASLNGNEAIVKILLANDADANAKDQDGWTPLHAAIIRGHGCVVDSLVDKVANGQQIIAQTSHCLRDPDNKAWLMELAANKSEGSLLVSGLRSVVNSGYHERVQALLSAGEDIDAVDSVGGSTALTLATWLGNVSMVKLLLENGASVNHPDHYGDTALYIAAKDGYSELVKLLVHSGAAINDTVYGWTPLLVAIKECCFDGYEEVVKALIDGGANVRVTDYHGRTALHWAAKYRKTTLAQDLIRRGASVDAQDRWGITPLIRAIAGEHTSKADLITDLLLQNHANVNIETFEGYRAVHVAACAGNTSLLSRLLNAGADLEARVDKIGLTPLDIAQLMDQNATVEFMRQKGCEPSEATQWVVARNAACERLAASDENGKLESIDIDVTPNELAFCKELYEVVLDHAVNEQSNDHSLESCAAMEKLTFGTS